MLCCPKRFVLAIWAPTSTPKKCNNLAIYVVDFFVTFFTPYLNSPKWDPMVESQKRVLKYQFMQFVLEVAVFECYFSKP
jgi:hypothetical protein